MRIPRLRLPGFWTAVFGLLLVSGLAITVQRFTQGLGAVTNLSDRFPWGLWVGVDVLCGVGLAAGGFTITTAVYVFNLERFRPIVRPTILTAFLGYLLVAVALMYDLGKPWNIWHPMVMWNPRSPMFEVSWCVMLYLTVLALEFSGIVFEWLRWTRAVAIQHAATVPLVIAGAVISTLHQSSLGTFYLIAPAKMHALWYTPLLPWMFYLSAIAAGLAMVIVESRLSSRAFGKGLELPLVVSIGRGLQIALVLYLAARLADMLDRGVIMQAVAGSRESWFFLLEVGIGVILPVALLALPAVRRNAERLYGVALLTVAGFVVNRLNVSITALEGVNGTHYVPTLAEGIVTLMLIGVGMAAFGLAVRYLPIMHTTTGAVPMAAAPRPVLQPDAVSVRG